MISKQTRKRMFLILGVASTIALILLATSFAEDGQDGKVLRNAYGKGDRKEEYEITVGNQLRKEPFVVEVKERKYTSREIQEIFKKVIKELDTVILGENQSLDRVETDLNLVTELESYPIQIQWESDNYEVISMQGEIQHAHTKESGTLVEIRGTLTYEGEEALYVTSAMIYPKRKNKKEQLLENIRKELALEEEKTREKESFQLPEKVGKDEIEWAKKPDLRGYYVLLLGILGAAMMPALEKQNQIKEEKARKAQMLTDYPEIINKFTLLLSTGMTVKSVWEKIVSNYEEQKPVTGERAAYEEMCMTFREMKGGITEKEAYERFGERCGISIYIKFGALLTQNLRKGTKGISELLKVEAIQAFENRKNRAKQLGEEASTKLLVPMFGMLAVVLVIVVVPAFLSIQL